MLQNVTGVLWDAHLSWPHRTRQEDDGRGAALPTLSLQEGCSVAPAGLAPALSTEHTTLKF